MSFVKICPDCGAEFVPTVELCFDCGSTLETRPEAAAEAEGNRRAGAPAGSCAAPAEEPLPNRLVAIETADLDWARELEERLAGHRIEARLASQCGSCRPTLTVLVEAADAEAARRVAHALYLEKVPEAEGSSLALPPVDRCPACGATVGEAAAQCPDCGLALLTAG